jgi:hypothetical protein
LSLKPFLVQEQLSALDNPAHLGWQEMLEISELEQHLETLALRGIVGLELQLVLQGMPLRVLQEILVLQVTVM